MTSQQSHLADLLRFRADRSPDKVAYTFLNDGSTDARSLTWAALFVSAETIARCITTYSGAHGPVVVLQPSGLAFIQSLFGCWLAGAIPVPLSIPRHQRIKHRLDRILDDVDASLAIAPAEVAERINGEAGGGMRWIDPSALTECSVPFNEDAREPIALIQYTSGSTGAPKGVLVTHDNLMHNSSAIAEVCGHGESDTIGGWLPLFHDMGLIGLVIQAAYAGAHCVLMSPERFLMRPWLWLELITRYRVHSSPAPNFAYDLCTRRIDEDRKAAIDLSSWRCALNGSESVRPKTLEGFTEAFASCGFRRSAFLPCYGLAEATLMAAASPAGREPIITRIEQQASSRGGDGQQFPGGLHVSCGRAAGDLKIAIVDWATSARVPDGAIGEIWLAGDSCALGYWQNAEATDEVFNALLADGTGPWLRTGDLGVVRDGELYITGRLRDLIIIAGRNLFPVDIEETAVSAHEYLHSGSAAAFSVMDDTSEKLALVIEPAPMPRRDRQNNDACPPLDDVVAVVRSAIAVAHDVVPADIVIVKSGTIPRTTSGKTMRAACRAQYLARTLERLEN